MVLRELYIYCWYTLAFSPSHGKANRARTAPVWHIRRLRISSRGSTFDSGMYTLHPRQPVGHLSMSLARAHLPCSDPFTARSRTQSLRYLSSRPTYCVTRQRATRRCQTSALFPSRGGQRGQKLRAPRLSRVSSCGMCSSWSGDGLRRRRRRAYCDLQDVSCTTRTRHWCAFSRMGWRGVWMNSRRNGKACPRS
jgi:hypothetical protein